MKEIDQNASQFHIAMFLSSLSRGGSERVMVNLAAYMVSRGYRVSLITQYQNQNEFPLPEGVTRYYSEITAEEMGGRLHNVLARYGKLRRLWKTLQPDVILSFIGKNNLMAILTAIGCKSKKGVPVRVAVSVRGEPSEEYYSGTMMRAANFLFPKADAVILQTEKSKDYFAKKVADKAVIMKNQLNPSFLQPVYEGEREPEIVLVGRVDANKNHEMAIRAFAAISEKFSNYRMTIYGDGDCRQKLQNLVKELGKEDVIFLPGATGDVYGAIRKASLFVLTSYSEGLPNTILEAMAQGIPVISTDCPSGGPAQLITDHVNGILVPVGDTKALQEAMEELLSNPQCMRGYGKQAEYVRTAYEPEAVNREWETLLTGLV